MDCRTCASTKWPIRALAITGIETASMMPSIMSGSLIRATPPWARMSAGTRSRAITATAPASSAIFAWSGVTTSMITPPLSISAIPRLTREVPCSGAVVLSGVLSAMVRSYVRGLGRLTPYLPHAQQHRLGAGEGEHPQRELHQDRHAEEPGEPGHHQDCDRGVGALGEAAARVHAQRLGLRPCVGGHRTHHQAVQGQAQVEIAVAGPRIEEDEATEDGAVADPVERGVEERTERRAAPR